MAIWRGTSAMPTVGPDVHLKYKVLSGGENWGQGATQAVGNARLMLRYILTKLGKGWGSFNDNQKNVGDYYFQLGGAPSGTDLDVILQTLQLTSNGLFGSSLNVKITVQDEAHGYVAMHHSRWGGKSRWNSGFDPRPGQNYRKTKFGDIHLDTDAIDKNPMFAALTLIHEATHKFASTGDYQYVDEDNGQYEGAITKAQALNNADSYGYFVVGCFQERTQ